MNRHPSLLFEHPMKNLTERGYSLLFVFFFLIRKCGTVFPATFRWYSSQRIPRHVDIRKVFVHPMPSGGGHVPMKR